ncbi:MAG: hypothetical protein LBC27_10155, partial [Spirochaetaceae bacterium]|nr:hypothetical protein [Spirochaetaceae bacterium]
LDYNYAPMNVRELSEVVDEWLYKYHFYRPHAALGFLTPAAFPLLTRHSSSPNTMSGIQCSYLSIGQCPQIYFKNSSAPKSQFDI